MSVNICGVELCISKIEIIRMCGFVPLEGLTGRHEAYNKLKIRNQMKFIVTDNFA